MRSRGDTGTRVSLSELTQPTDPRLRALAEVLQRTFPDPNTVLGLDRIQEFLFSDGTGQRRFFVLAALDPGQTVVGGSVFSYVPAANCGFSEYLALDPTWRGRGAGRELVEARASILDREAQKRGHARCHGVFIEVDSPVRTPSALLDAERTTSLDAVERVKLFAHLGFRRVDVHYVQPPLGVGKNAVDYLDLLFAPTESGLRSIPAEWVLATVEPIWSAWAPETFARHLAELRSQVVDARESEENPRPPGGVALLDPLDAE